MQTQLDQEKEAKAGIEAEVKKLAGETNSLKRVELENILQDYHDKIDAQRVSSVQ